MLKTVREFLFETKFYKIPDRALSPPPPETLNDENTLGDQQILEKIFCNLSPKDLIRIRSVCLTWNLVACKLLQRRLSYTKLPPSRIRKFTRLMKKSIANPFGSFALRIENLKDSLIVHFFQCFGQDVINLRVRSASSEFPKLLKLLYQLRNLEHAHVIRIPEETRTVAGEDYSNEIWKCGIHTVDHLRSIIFENENSSQPFIRSYDSCVIDIINSSPKLESVKFYSWETRLSQLFDYCMIDQPDTLDGWTQDFQLKVMYIEELLVKNLHFKTLGISLRNLDEYLKLQSWIECLSSSLLHLAVKTDPSFKSEVPFTVPCTLNKLCTLQLHMWDGFVDFHSIQNFVPNLTTIRLHETTLSQILENYKSLHDICFPSVITLSVMSKKGIEDDFLITFLSQMFPNILHLFVSLVGNDSAHSIYKNWPGLEMLLVQFICVDDTGDETRKPTDESITGIASEGKFNTMKYSCGCTIKEYKENSKRATDISCLKKLSTLIIISDQEITNGALIQGICNLSELQILWLVPLMHATNDPYKWCIKAIADGLPKLTNLILSNKLKYSSEELKYLHEKLPCLNFMRKY